MFLSGSLAYRLLRCYQLKRFVELPILWMPSLQVQKDILLQKDGWKNESCVASLKRFDEKTFFRHRIDFM